VGRKVEILGEVVRNGNGNRRQKEMKGGEKK
jgi:hypothetical protein